MKSEHNKTSLYVRLVNECSDLYISKEVLKEDIKEVLYDMFHIIEKLSFINQVTICKYIIKQKRKTLNNE